jgi:hypothetical protein
MPLLTQHYGLAGLRAGEKYSSVADKSRFTIIDNEMFFIAQLITDGNITGWRISQENGFTITVSAGKGLIGGIVTETFGFLKETLSDNDKFYIYLLRRDGIISLSGPVTDLFKLTYFDSTIPVKVAGLMASVSFDSISLSWTPNPDVDIDFYSIFRSSDNVTFAKVGAATVTSFNDQGLNPNTTYYYKVSATDLNSHEGVKSDALIATTGNDQRIPGDPTGVIVIPGNKLLQLFWYPGSGNIDHYELFAQPIDDEGNNDGPLAITNVPGSAIQETLLELDNVQSYQLTIKSVSPYGVKSNGVSVVGTPSFHPGPAEISNLQLSDFKVNLSGHVGINVQWTVDTDPYADQTSYFLVTIAPFGGTTSEPSIYTSQNISITAYSITSGNDFIIIPISEKTEYYIRVQAVDAAGKANRGITGRIITRKFSPPPAVSSLVITSPTSTRVRATWSNSVGEFSFNQISVTKTDLLTHVATTIELDTNIGKQSFYEIPTQFIGPNTQFEVSVTAIDSYGNVSSTEHAFFTIGAVTPFIVKPPIPANQNANGGDRSITVVWSDPDTTDLLDTIVSFKVWRAIFQVKYGPEDFVLLSTVPSTQHHYMDFEVNNDSRYVYFVTSISESGAESLNPVDDGFVSYPLQTARAFNYSGLSIPLNLVVTPIGSNVELSWTASQDDFDGYQILRSQGTKNTFTVVGTVDNTETSFTDTNALLVSGDYYYLVRKFKNEADLFITKSTLSPVGSVLLGTVSFANGHITVDQSSMVNIKNMEGPIRAYTRAALNVPHHLFITESDDRRINLSNSFIVSNWQTQDFTQYKTVTDISFTDAYVVFIDGEESDLLNEIDRVNGTLVFEQPIYDISKGGTAPVVSVQFLDVTETVGTLPSSAVGQISAQQITRGFVEPSLLQQIDHQGRIKEPLLSITKPMTSSDGFKFTINGSVGDGTVFYDVIAEASDNLNFLAATSGGILLSSNAGTQWDVIFASATPIHKLYYSYLTSTYFALSFDQVYQSTSSSLTSWSVIDGLASVHVVRDIVEDSFGNIYISTDQGVYRYRPGEFTKAEWIQTSLFDFGESDSYALFYDGFKVTVSTNNGLYETTDQGLNWWQSITFFEKAPIWAFATISQHDGSATFMISKDRLWRMTDSQIEFKEVAFLGNTFARKMVVFDGRIFVSTNNGIVASDQNANLVNDTLIPLLPAFQSLERNGKIPCATSLNTIGTNIWVGTEQRLYSSPSTGVLSLHAEYPSTVVPTVYINNIEHQIGQHYVNGTGSIYFDIKQSADASITIINDYSTFIAENGGWADANYRAPIRVRVNGNIYDSQVITADLKAIGDMALPNFDPRNSNVTAANDALANLVPYLNGFVARSDQQTAFNTNLVVTSEAITELFKRVETFQAALYPEIRNQLVIPPLKASFVRIFPSSNTDDNLQITITCNVVTGIFGVSPSLDKYSAINMDVYGVPLTNTGSLSHHQLEDALELVNSGLPSDLARVQQANIAKLGIYNERINPDNRGELSPPYQAVFNTPYSSTVWYDRLNSTIDYDFHYGTNPNGLDLPYAKSVTKAGSDVWVGGLGGILVVNLGLNTVSRLKFPTQNNISVLSIYNEGTTVYILTTDGLYTYISGVLTKDVDLPVPNNTNSLIFLRGSYIAATADGLFSRKLFDLTWKKILDIRNVNLNVSGNNVIAYGTDPRLIGSVAYTSVDGLSWSSATVLQNLEVTGVARFGSTIYFATKSGLYVEDLAKLQNNVPPVSLVDLLSDASLSKGLIFNDVAADSNRVIAAVNDGTYYVYSNGTFSQFDSGLGVLHKCEIIDGSIWLLGRMTAKVEGINHTIRLSTGEALL